MNDETKGQQTGQAACSRRGAYAVATHRSDSEYTNLRSTCRSLDYLYKLIRPSTTDSNMQGYR